LPATDLTEVRFQKAYLFAGVIAVTKVLASAWYGPGLLVLLAPGVATMAAARFAHERARHPELVTATAFFLLQVDTAVSGLVSGGATSPLLPLLAIPVFSQAVCCRPQVFLTGVGVSGVLAVPAVLLGGSSAAASPPVVHLVGYLALLASLSVGGHYLATADRAPRDEAVVDPMTGLLNRLTLSSRSEEAQRSVARTAGSVGLVMCDVDHFTAVNDTHGHGRGDRVLRELAVRLPGRDAAAARAVAERIRASVAAAPVTGLPVTVSAGVVTGSDGATLDEMLRAADHALDAAKAAGRDRVVAVVLPAGRRPEPIAAV
jgi:GGDEF domain-containing protein